MSQAENSLGNLLQIIKFPMKKMYKKLPKSKMNEKTVIFLKIFKKKNHLNLLFLVQKTDNLISKF